MTAPPKSAPVSTSRAARIASARGRPSTAPASMAFSLNAMRSASATAAEKELAQSDADNGVTPEQVRALPPARAQPISLSVRVAQVLLALFFILSLVAFGIDIWYLVSQQATQIDFAWAIAGIFVAFSVGIAAHTIHMHLLHYVSPLQRYYVRIALIIIVYSTQSWLALRFFVARIYIVAIRDLYEAYAVYSFYQLMLHFLGGQRVLAARLLATGRARSTCLPCFFCCARGGCCLPWRMGMRFVHRVEVGIYQYVVIRIIVSLATIATAAAGVYTGFSPLRFNLYGTIAVNISQAYALTVLVLFYLNTKQWIAPLKPLYKFLTIKIIIFVLFWQSVIVAVAGFYGAITAFWTLPSEAAAASGIEDFALCIELFVFAILVNSFFSYRDFWSPTGEVPPLAHLRLYQQAFLRRHATESAAVAAAAAAAAGRSNSQRGSGGGGSEGSGSNGDEDLRPTELVLPEPSPQQPPRLRGVVAAALDVLPVDIIVQTGEHVRSGFGLAHKWHKRAESPRNPEVRMRRRPPPCCCLYDPASAGY